ncbi:MAG: hypothetical protein M3O34_10365 [Chloroflexota bacterium]|nr:hypothetical protein [Chloroflexota bacterium]
MDDATASSPSDLDDWQLGRRINLRGRKKVVLAAGMLSRSGEALHQFDGFVRYLESNFGYTRGDVLEVSYSSAPEGDDWRPTPYDAHHSHASLRDVSAQAGRTLRWYRALLPDDTEYHLIGYSLGGVALFEAAGALLLGEPERWRGRLGSLTTLSAPLFGADLGLEGELLGALGFGALFSGGDSVRELLARGRNPNHRALVERLAARLRAAGVRVMTLADANDVVVTPEDAIIAPPGERDRHVLSGPRVPGAGLGLGHGQILSNTLAWVRMAKQIGPQEPRAS